MIASKGEGTRAIVTNEIGVRLVAYERDERVDVACWLGY
jgi:hypothetical protein